MSNAEFSLERQEVPFRVMTETGLVAIEDGEIDEAEKVFDILVLDDLVEEPGYVCWRIAKSPATHG